MYPGLSQLATAEMNKEKSTSLAHMRKPFLIFVCKLLILGCCCQSVLWVYLGILCLHTVLNLDYLNPKGFNHSKRTASNQLLSSLMKVY